jgi:hypothetical protein
MILKTPPKWKPRKNYTTESVLEQYGNSALTSAWSMWSVLKCDYVAVIVSQPVFQASPNHFSKILKIFYKILMLTFLRKVWQLEHTDSSEKYFYWSSEAIHDCLSQRLIPSHNNVQYYRPAIVLFLVISISRISLQTHSSKRPTFPTTVHLLPSLQVPYSFVIFYFLSELAMNEST